MDAIRFQQLAHRLYVKNIPFIPRLITWLLFHACHCDLSARTTIGKRTTLGHKGMGIVINAISKIGADCVIAQNVTLAGNKGKAPIVGNYCYIGCNSVILGGVKLSDNVTVGACSFVNCDIPENAVVVGSPAKIIKIKDEEEINAHKEMIDKMHHKR